MRKIFLENSKQIVCPECDQVYRIEKYYDVEALSDADFKKLEEQLKGFAQGITARIIEIENRLFLVEED